MNLLQEDIAATTLLIPVFNEEAVVKKLIDRIYHELPGIKTIVVNDGSTDGTGKILAGLDYSGLQIVGHDFNRGYGASIKTALRAARTDIVVWMDSDGQHDLADLPRFIMPLRENLSEAVLGARVSGSSFVIKRVPGKIVLKLVSQLVARRKIPDLNCGYRSFKRSLLLRYAHLLPDGFSASSTSTLVLLKRGYRVKFLPILTHAREGKSTVKIWRDGLNTIKLIWNIFILFDSFLFFGICASLQILAGLGYSLAVILRA